MEKKYKALRFIGGLYRVIAYIVLVAVILGVLAADVSLIAGGEMISDWAGYDLGGAGIFVAIFMTIFGLLGGGLVFITLYAVSDLVSLLISVEEATRFTALVLRDRPQ
jgi:hypothetical protein